jgi:hypothetical protein
LNGVRHQKDFDARVGVLGQGVGVTQRIERSFVAVGGGSLMTNRICIASSSFDKSCASELVFVIRAPSAGLGPAIR